MKNYLKSIIYTLITLLIGTIIIAALNYFNILNGLPHKIVSLLIPIIAMLIGSFLIGKTSTQKGYIEGIKYGIIWVILLLIINLITKNFTLTSIIYYVILLLLSTLAAALGINKRKN